MRDRLQPYSGIDRLNYLCLFAMDTLRTHTLQDVPILLAGHRSVGTSGPVDLERAIHHLRLNGLLLTTQRALLLFIEQYRTHHRIRARQEEPKGSPQRFRVNDDFSFTRLWENIVPDDIHQARQSLATTPPLAPRRIPPLAPPGATSDIRRGEGKYNGHVAMLGFEPPPPPVHDVDRVPRAPGLVSWASLVEQAREFDRIDEAAGRQEAGACEWYARLYNAAGQAKAELCEPGVAGLGVAAGIDLRGVKHLIGLPGAGKTTLLTLLAAVLESRGFRACFLFPSIEVASGFIEVLHRYNVSTGLLYGQSENARTRHVANFAASLAQSNGGFGAIRATAPNFATNCALAAWASDEEEPFPHATPPCLELETPDAKGKRRKHLCGLSGVCGRQHAERNLALAPIWAGHILSLDRRVSPLYCKSDLRMFELLARTFDLVVVDECDNAQSSLDERGTAVMRLVSNESSMTAELLASLHGRVSRGDNAFLRMEHMGSITEMAGRFMSANSRLVHLIMQMKSDYVTAFKDMLLTSASLVAEIYPAPDRDDDDAAYDAHVSRRTALERIWDIASKQVAYRDVPPGDEEDRDEDEEGNGSQSTQRLAMALGWQPEEVSALVISLRQSLAAWDAHPTDSNMAVVVEAFRSARGFQSDMTDAQFAEVVALLTGVTQVVLQFFGLAPFLRILTAAGLIEEDVFESRPSLDLLRILPESLLGRMAGLRYSIASDGDVHLQHVSLAGVPRLLPQRLAQLGPLEGRPAPSVLLTSATSMLADSPSFHVDGGPHYLLRRPDSGQGWKNSRYRTVRLSWPGDPDRALRFSGARYAARDQVLRAMADGLLHGGEFGHLATAIAENDLKNGVGRRGAFVLNSYEQCETLARHISQMHPERAERLRYLVRGSGSMRGRGVTASEVESLGRDPNWDLLLFPMGAIGRGVNIVYQFGPRAGDAMIGSLFFLTRPHPRADSLQLLQGLAGQASARFDAADVDGRSMEQMLGAYREARQSTRRLIHALLRTPLMASRLGPLARPFVADQMVTILQTIGRAMRNDCPAFVYFVDAAWAPLSAQGRPDTPRSSMLVMMQKILEELLRHPDPSTRMFYENLYAPFHGPLSRIEGLMT